MPISVLVGQASLPSPHGPNQDYAGAVTPDGGEFSTKGVVLAIADGVGKVRGGGVLAEATVRTFLTGWYASPETWSASRCLGVLGKEANDAARRDHPGAACTLTAAVVLGRFLHVLHLGDSRAWLVRQGQARQLTTDHVWDAPEMRSVLHRAVGLDEEISPQIFREEIREGDLVVLATDGFHKAIDLVSEPLVIEEGESLDAAAHRAVRMAKTRGSDDDATILLARIDRLPTSEAGFFGGSEPELPAVEGAREGLEFDGFRLQKKLGGGRRTSVWLADDHEEERRVVIKIPDPQSVLEPGVREEFLREEWVGKRIQHPAVVPVIGLRGGRRTRLYYVMPWTSGTSLRRILTREGFLDAYAVTQLGLELAPALRAMHRLGVLHRDIKPDNILRDDLGRNRLTDLGVAQVEAFFDERGSEPGTPSYMAPEMFLGSPASEATEIFALGVTLYESLTRRLPYGEIEPFTRPKFSLAPPASRFNPQIPPWLDSVVMCAIEPDPKNRFKALSELEFHLERRERVSDQNSPPPVDPERRLRFWIGLALLGLLLSFAEAVALVAVKK